jgi:hypothetical protein
MKKYFLAFSILLSFSFSWAESDRPANPGTDPIEQHSQDGASANVVGAGGYCAACQKHTWNGPLNANTNPAPAGTGTNPNSPVKGDGNTQ